jgi:hypothetical protein
VGLRCAEQVNRLIWLSRIDANAKRRMIAESDHCVMQKWGLEAARPQIKKNGEKFKLERGGWEKTSPIPGSRLTSGQLLCFQKECNQS